MDQVLNQENALLLTTVRKFVEEEIFSRLSGAEKRVLGAIAVYREPMPLEALSNHEIETDLLDDLVEKGLAENVFQIKLADVKTEYSDINDEEKPEWIKIEENNFIKVR